MRTFLQHWDTMSCRVLSVPSATITQGTPCSSFSAPVVVHALMAGTICAAACARHLSYHYTPCGTSRPKFATVLVMTSGSSKAPKTPKEVKRWHGPAPPQGTIRCSPTHWLRICEFIGFNVHPPDHAEGGCMMSRIQCGC